MRDDIDYENEGSWREQTTVSKQTNYRNEHTSGE